MDPKNVPDSRDMGDVDPDSEGFTSDYDPKTARGVPGAEGSEDGNYESQDDIREWETQGEFGPDDDVSRVFSEVMDSPAEELEEDHEVVTDGGVPYDDDKEPYTDGGRQTMADIDHGGPYGEFEEGGAPW